MSNTGSLWGEPARLIGKALELDSNNFLALALAGSAAVERGDYVAAITHWTKLVNLLPPDNPELQMLRDGIRQAREFLAMQPGGKEKLAQLPDGNAPQKAAAGPIEVVARIPRPGAPIAKPGDLQGMAGAIKPGASGLSIVIDSIVQ